MYYYGARYYDPRISIFVSVDPLAEQTMEPYLYTGNNPIMFTDPTGMSKVGPPDPPGFWGSFFGSVARGIGAVVIHAVNNPNHAGYGYERPKVSDFAAYQIDWGQQLDPTWQAQNFASIAVQGVSGFVGGIIDGDGARTAQSIPKLVGTFGVFNALRGKGIKNVDLMGGPQTSFKGFKNFDLADNGLGINDYVSNFGNYFKPSSLKNVLVNNPQSSFLGEISGLMAKGGNITVRGTKGNSYFQSVFDGTADGMDGFEVISRQTGLKNKGYNRTDGTPIKGQNNINEIVLRKK